jgi:hypothetical protein
MSRAPSAFRQTDVVKAIKAVHIAGCKVARVLISKGGQIEVVTAVEGGAQGKPGGPADTDLDRELTEWEERRGR